MYYNENMILWPFLFMSVVFAAENSVEQYCFSSPSRMELVLNKTKPLLLPSDQINKESHCFTLQLPEHRRELIQNYIRGIAPDLKVTFSSAEIRRDPCKLKVEKIGSNNSSDINISLEEASSKNQKLENKETMQIQTLKEFQLVVNQEAIKGECRYINQDRYEIKIAVAKFPKPILYNSVENTPKDEQTFSLQTQLQLNRGERINIGSTVKDIRAKEHSIKIEPSAEYKDLDGNINEQVYLSLE